MTAKKSTRKAAKRSAPRGVAATEHRICPGPDHSGCGHDMNAEFDAGPHDGLQYFAACPQCGAGHGYLAPAS